MTPTEKMIALLGELRRQTNGAVTGSMESRGVTYRLNYGVALHTIRKIAAAYAPDHPLALHLYRQDVRELKIAAACIADPEQTTAAQMREWALGSPSDEVTELLAMNLFCKCSDAPGEMVSWLGSGDPKLAAAAVWTAGNMPSRAAGMIAEIGSALRDGNGHTARGAVFALRKIAALSDDDKDAVLKLIGPFRSGTHAQKYVAEELEWLLNG